MHVEHITTSTANAHAKDHEREIQKAITARPFAQLLHMQHNVTAIDLRRGGGGYEGRGNGSGWIYSTVLVFSS